MVQLSHPYMTIGKTIALSIRDFVGKVTSLFFNVLSRFVIAFLPKSKRLLISWVQSVTICSDFGAPQNKVCHCVHCFPIYLPWSDGTRCHNLSFLNVEFYFFLFRVLPCNFNRTLLKYFLFYQDTDSIYFFNV